MKWRLTLLVIIMLTVTMPALAESRPQPPVQRLGQLNTDIAPYDRITSYCFHPTQDYNYNGVVNESDSFVEFYHHQDTPTIMELGIFYYWECENGFYSAIQFEGIHQGYNRLYSAEFYRFNTGLHAITIKDAITDDYIDWLYYESLCQSPYPIVEYR